jgi:hypothetical protein
MRNLKGFERSGHGLMKAFIPLLHVVTEKNPGNLRMADDGQGSNVTFNQNYNLQKENNNFKQFYFHQCTHKNF